MKKINKSSTEKSTEGPVRQSKSTDKNAAGNLSDMSRLKVVGFVEKIAGKIRNKIGVVKKVFAK